MDGGNLTLRDVLLEGNVLTGEGAGIRGGGLLALQGAGDPSFVRLEGDTRLRHNVAPNGSAMHVERAAVITVLPILAGH